MAARLPLHCSFTGMHYVTCIIVVIIMQFMSVVVMPLQLKLSVKILNQLLITRRHMANDHKTTSELQSSRQ